MELKTLVDNYGVTNAQYNLYKKQYDQENKEIKSIIDKIMHEEELTEYTCEGSVFKATVKEKITEDFNEGRLLMRLKELGVEGVIKTREYVDMDELESAIYNGEVDATKLADCKDSTRSIRLTISKIKK